ncbi:MAG: peptide chain release factor 1 [Steroidobacteraceae bacterium]
MKDSIRRNLERLLDRYVEVGRLLSDPEVLARPDRFRDLSVEYARLEPVARRFDAFLTLEREREALAGMVDDDDPDLRGLAEEEQRGLEKRLAAEEDELALLLIPKDPHDDSNIFLEIRAAAGGDEAAIFAGDLLRMYARYAESQGWKVELLSANPGEHGGYREVVCRIVGRGAYSRLKFESGTHRVQRVPATEAQGRIHTSTCTVAILPELDEVEEIAINPAELRIDTYRSSGAGGQHVNKTDSAVRITHLPTGTVVECQDERSQHKNRARALSLLQARLVGAERERQQTEQARARRLQVGTGDRSERIRTYNFPQGRMTDHRIDLTLYRLDDIVNGRLDEVIGPLTREHQAQELAQLT